jgi:predicted ArsR family transcriptional regulator
MNVSLTEAKRHLDKLIARVFARRRDHHLSLGRPAMRLEPVQVAKPKNQAVHRTPGRLIGKISDSKGTFNPGE